MVTVFGILLLGSPGDPCNGQSAPAVFQWGCPMLLGRRPIGDESIEAIMERIDGARDVRAMYRKLAMDEELDGVDLRVFLWLSSVADFENFTRIEQRKIAVALKRHKEHISRSMRKLKTKEVILEASPRVGRSAAYMLNPKYGK